MQITVNQLKEIIQTSYSGGYNSALGRFHGEDGTEKDVEQIIDEFLIKYNI